jgi:hypothetical protein
MLALVLVLSLPIFGQSSRERPASEPAFSQLAAEDYNRRPPASGPASIDAKRLKQDIDRFSAAVTAYREAVNSNSPLDKLLKELKTSSNNFERYSRDRFAPKFDKSPFAKLSRGELVKETLKAAEIVKADLAGLIKIGDDPRVLWGQDARQYLLEFRYEVERLRFLIDKTKSAK